MNKALSESSKMCLKGRDEFKKGINRKKQILLIEHLLCARNRVNIGVLHTPNETPVLWPPHAKS